ncbi:glycosyltransferase, partial [Vibrio sp. 10N.261.48.A2]
SRTLIICPKVDSYNGIMKDGDNCLMFKEDMSDFSLVLEKAQDENVRLPIINNAQKFVRQHTYEARAKKIIEVIQGTESDSKQ